MYQITYSLRRDGINSDKFYQDTALFTDEVLREIAGLTSKYLEGYTAYVQAQGTEEVCSKEEYGLDLLVLGVLWQTYSGDVTELNEAPQKLLTQLAKLREQGGSIKPGLDFLRGILATIFLAPDLYDNMFVLAVNLVNMAKLLDWLEATGEFKQEVKRLRQWQIYLGTQSDPEICAILGTVLALATWFKVRSEEVLGGYTPNVDRYLNELRPERYWREDVIFCGRRRVEYHLNMVGAEIMNRAYREAFLRTGKKVVVLPACLRLLPGAKCQAASGKNGFHCMRCVADCSVHELTKLGQEYGFDVVVIPHESSLAAGQSDHLLFGSDVGVIGIACVLNLISGGWLLKDMGLPAQCVVLDYCGCKNHWSKEGIPTEINMKQLKRILGLDI